jgi:hypothetical protein
MTASERSGLRRAKARERQAELVAALKAIWEANSYRDAQIIAFEALWRAGSPAVPHPEMATNPPAPAINEGT